MSKKLTQRQIDHFHEFGYVAPVRVLSTQQTLRLRQRLEDFEQSQGGPLKGSQRFKTHLLFGWLNDLVRDASIVDAIEDLYGGNILCWATHYFAKEPHDPAFVSWHQDSTYWGLSKPDVVTAWVALSESNEANGALKVIPGTHSLDQIPHVDTYNKNNALTRGQEIAVDVDASKAVTLELQPGEMSLHHVRIIHGSEPNNSDVRRIGIAIRYIPASVRQLQGDDSATLVRGVDEFKTFGHEPRPQGDYDPELHNRYTSQNEALLLKGANLRKFEDVNART